MKIKTLLCAMLFVPGISVASADDVGHGRDHDIPDAQPPAETETTTENMLQQLLELFGIDAE